MLIGGGGRTAARGRCESLWLYVSLRSATARCVVASGSSRDCFMAPGCRRWQAKWWVSVRPTRQVHDCARGTSCAMSLGFLSSSLDDDTNGKHLNAPGPWGCIVVRRILVVCGVVVAASTPVIMSAGASIPPQGKVGPHQYFEALVNGETGIGTSVPIKMACFGAVHPGEKGHPMAGQTVEVRRPLVIVFGHSGYTGKNATSIMGFFGPPPPTAVTPLPTTSTVTFTRYGVKKAIPQSLLLPCSGTGRVYFIPFPQSPPSSRDAIVSVSYVGQP
jgi:hypothetical protein